MGLPCQLVSEDQQIPPNYFPNITNPFADSPYRTAISGAVLKMQEEGKLHQLKTRWWKEMHGGGRCDEQATTAAGDSAAELGIDNVGGVFVVLAFGCFCAFILGILEFFWNVRKVAVDEKVS